VIAEDLDTLDPDQLRQALRASRAEIAFKQAVIDKLTHENAILKRLKFAAKSEAYSAEQKSLLDETLDSDLAAVAAEIEGTQTAAKAPGEKQAPSVRRCLRTCRAARSATSPRTPPAAAAHRCSASARTWPRSWTISLACSRWSVTSEASGCAGAAIRRVKVGSRKRQWHRTSSTRACPRRVSWPRCWWPSTWTTCRCTARKRSSSAPVISSPGLRLHKWVGECGVQLQPLVDALAVELLRQPVLHAYETPVAMLKPGHGKTHRAYLWSYCTTPCNPIKAVVFDFADSRGGQHVRGFLGLPGTPEKPGWQGKLVTDDFSGYKACFELGVTEVGCMAHARRKFHELWANHGSQVGEQALKFFGALYDVEREVADANSQTRLDARRRSRPVADALHQWMRQQRQKIPDGSATARAIDYSLNRWVALTRFLDDGDLPIDNNWVENRIRPIAIGRQNWLFAGSLRAGKRAAAVMSLIHSARLNGLDPYAYMRDVLERLPTQPASQIAELLPHHWQPITSI
jgi:transposase